jgi:hypothetical protein
MLSCLEKATLDEAIVNASYGRHLKSIIISVGWIKVDIHAACDICFTNNYLDPANTYKNAFKMSPFVGILIVSIFFHSC